MRKIILIILIAAFSIPTKGSNLPLQKADQKIISLNGTISEILAGLGFEGNIIGTDITSNYPAALKSKPKLGHNKNISAEGIIALQPDIVTALRTDIKPELVTQLKSAGIKLILFSQDFSVDGTKKLINDVADAFGNQAKAIAMVKKLDADLAKAKKAKSASPKAKVLFIYARGTGTMMVAGEGTPVEKIIDLAGGQNVIKGFTDYKPLTAEALIAGNPDVILLFSTGMESLGGDNGLLKVQGIAQTNAGKRKKFITMEGELLTGFGPRLGEAVLQLSQKLN